MYVFFDVDGVLNNINSKKLYTLDNSCVEAFAKYIKHNCPNPKLIIISSWRNGFEKDYSNCSEPIKRLIDALKPHGLTITDKTMNAPDKDRAKEIMHYLKWHDMDSFIIVDDDASEYKTPISNLEIINGETGFR